MRGRDRQTERPNPKTFKERDDWMRAVLASDLPSRARCLAIAIGLRLNVNAGQCNPGYALLATELRMSARSGIRTVAVLERAGWIKVTRAGHHRPNQFSLLRGDKALSRLRGDKALSPQSTSEVTNSNVRGDKTSHSEVTHAVTHKAKRTAKRKEKGSKTLPSLSLQDQEEDFQRKQGKKESGPASRGPDASFDRFWSIYPRHTAEPRARKAWARAIKDAVPEIIIEAAKRYAAKRQAEITRGDDPKWTSFACNWLNDRLWNERYEVTDGNSPPTIIDNLTGKPVALAPRRRVVDSWEQAIADVVGERGNAKLR